MGFSEIMRNRGLPEIGGPGLAVRSLRWGDFVSYAGRAFRVRSLRVVVLEDAHFEALELAHTGYPMGVVFVPLHRVASTVARISKNEAVALDAAVPAVVTFAQSRMQKARAAQAAKVADWCRMGGIAKATRKRAA